LNLLLTLITVFITGSAAYAQSRNYQVEFNNPVKFDAGEESLNDSPGKEVAVEHRPLLELPRQSESNNRPDGALQLSSGPLVNTTPGTGFEGIDASGYAPPDTNMAVGPNHIVQWVNVRFAVFNKSGIMLPGYPKQGNAFWQGFGGPCETRNDGDPIIQYDAVADRWIASQFTAASPYYMCFAVSQTGDPTGAYYRYAYAFDGLPDYPKMGIGKNSYLGSYNMFSSAHGGWRGPRICAYDRAAMLVGANAVQECFNPGKSYGSLLPSDIDGGSAFAPPNNTGYFLDYGNNALLLWSFTPDFVTPSNATLTGPVTLAVASFSPACGGGTCIPQPSGQNLDSLADRLMYRLTYRNFGDHEALVVNHSVTAGTSVGVRWYEIRNPLTNPTVFQQGTFAPDSTYRWTGSAAMDKAGNIAIGYSASSSTSVPSIRYTGRESGDALNTLQTEVIIYSGGGSQTGGLSRWGDYSAIRIDPSDDCTFWYTTEYIPSNGSFNWRTRVASFKFNSCTAQPDFSIGATPPSRTVNAGDSTTYTVSTTALNGYSGSIALSTTGLPAGVSASFVPSSINGSGSSTLTVTTTAGTTPAGSFTLTIIGNDGTISHSTTVSLGVAISDFTISGSSASQTVNQGNGASYTISITASNGFSGTTALSISGVPANTTTSFNPTSVPGTGQSTLTVTTSASTPTGSYPLTITGTSGSLIHTTQVTLVVQSSSPPPSVNVALASNGAVALASSTYSDSLAPAGANNGDRKGLSWGSGGGWNDATFNIFPDWLEIDFNGNKTIHEIDVFSVQDNFPAPAEPTPSMTFTLYGLTDFQVQYLNGSQWLNVPNGVITGSNLVWRQVLFSDLTTNAIRVLVNGALASFSRIIEVEAWATASGNNPPTVDLNSPVDSTRFIAPATIALSATANDSDGSINRVDFYDGATLILTSPSSSNPYTGAWNNVSAGVHILTAVATDNLGATTTSAPVSVTVMPAGTINVALAANGGFATASSTYSSDLAPSGAINGDRKGLSWGADGGWNDATFDAYPDWIEVDFSGNKVIHEIDVVGLQDNFQSPVEPTSWMTFTLYGLTDFQAQYWTGSQWLDIPGGVITGNNLVLRQFIFSDITTTRIRVLVNGAVNSFSRVTELEAWGM